MNKIKKKGFTLIEIIIAIALLGILSVAFIPLFSTGVMSVIHAGNKSKAVYTTQKSIEEVSNGIGSGTVISTNGLNISIPGQSNINGAGKIESINTVVKNSNATIYFFVPTN